MDIYKKLEELQIEVRQAAVPQAAYVPFVQTGNLVFFSGTIALKDGKPWVGKLGLNMTTEEAKLAARDCAISLIGSLNTATGNNLNRVKRIVKLLSLVSVTDTFTEAHLVSNGASELLGKVFGDKGIHARSAIGVAQLPTGACVEIEMIVELEDD